MARVRKLPDITKYDDIPMLTGAGITRTTWTDADLLDTNALPLPSLGEDAIGVMVKKLLDALTGSVTEEDVYNILLLTWNMRSENDASKRIFPSKPPVPCSGKVSELSRLESVNKGQENQVEIPKEATALIEFNRQGCFYAASLLKLFTKSASSWMQAQAHIAESYKKFTEKDFMFSTLPVWEPSVEVIHRLMQTKPIYKKTLGMILYSLSSLTDGKGMTMMLFEQHLSYTGLHIVGLFCRAVVGLRTSPPELMTALFIRSAKPALDQLRIILETYIGSKEEELIRDTFKYSRLYDQNMFSLLQTKNCTDLTCILAYINKMCGIPGTENVLQIAAISTMSDDAKSVYEKIARNIFHSFKSSSDQECKDGKKNKNKKDKSLKEKVEKKIEEDHRGLRESRRVQS